MSDNEKIQAQRDNSWITQIHWAFIRMIQEKYKAGKFTRGQAARELVKHLHVPDLEVVELLEKWDNERTA